MIAASDHRCDLLSLLCSVLQVLQRQLSSPVVVCVVAIVVMDIGASLMLVTCFVSWWSPVIVRVAVIGKLCRTTIAKQVTASQMCSTHRKVYIQRRTRNRCRLMIVFACP